MIWHAIADCERLRELCRSLKEEIPKKYGLIEISQSQLSKVNKTRDYRVFVWIAYELLRSIWKDRRFWRIKQCLKVLGMDSTFLKWRSEHSEKGYCSSTGKIEEG